jgi:hypothetical protein
MPFFVTMARFFSPAATGPGEDQAGEGLTQVFYFRVLEGIFDE